MIEHVIFLDTVEQERHIHLFLRAHPPSQKTPRFFTGEQEKFEGICYKKCSILTQGPRLCRCGCRSSKIRTLYKLEMEANEFFFEPCTPVLQASENISAAGLFLNGSERMDGS